jgi:hypothetical protein
MGRGGEQADPSQAVLNHEDTIVFPPIPSKDNRSIDPPVGDLYVAPVFIVMKDLGSRSLLGSLY